MRIYQCFDVDETTPVQYCAVHPLRWRPEWGEPTALFREVDNEQQALFDAAPSLLEACKATHAALNKINGGGGFDLHDADRCRAHLELAINAAKGGSE